MQYVGMKGASFSGYCLTQASHDNPPVGRLMAGISVFWRGRYDGAGEVVDKLL